METQSNPGTDRVNAIRDEAAEIKSTEAPNKFDDRISGLNSAITELDRQRELMRNRIGFILRDSEPSPDAAKEATDVALLGSTEVDSSCIVTLDYAIRRLAKLIDQNEKLLDRLDI